MRKKQRKNRRPATSRTRIRTRIMLSLISLSLAMIIYVGFTSYRLASEKVTEVSLRLSESYTNSATTALNKALMEVRSWSLQFLSLPQLQDAIYGNGTVQNSSKLQRNAALLMASAEAHGPKMEFVSLLSADDSFSVFLSDYQLPFSDYASCIDYFSQQDEKMLYDYTSPRWLLCAAEGKQGSRNILVFLRFIYQPVGMEKMGVMVFGISEDWLSNVYTTYAEDAFIITKDGVFFSSGGNERLVGKAFQQNEAMLEAIRSEGAKEAASVQYKEENGREQIVSYQQLSNTHAYLVVPFDLYEGISAQEMNAFLRSVILMGAIGLLTTAVLSWLVANRLSRSIAELTGFTKRVERGETSLRYEPVGYDEVAYLGKQINNMLDQLQTAAQQREEDLRANQELELQLNQMQINPHLLYNSLDALLWVQGQGRLQDAWDLTVSLSEFFKTTLSRGRTKIPLYKELELIHHYINIQRMARQKQYSVEFDIAPELKALPVIKLTIQPLIENSVIHGFAGYRDNGTIRISAARSGDYVDILVTDNGIGMLPEEVVKINNIMQRTILPDDFQHFGLFNINRRIVQAYGQGCGLCIESEISVYSTIRMRIPYQPGEPVPESPSDP